MLSIESNRLVLRDMCGEDVPALHGVFSDPEVYLYMGYIKSDSLAQTEARVKEMIYHNSQDPRFAYSLSVIEKETGLLVGWIGFGDSDERNRHLGERDFGYAFGKAHWNKGYGTESLRRILAFVFTDLPTSAFCGRCDKRNPASARVMLKAGFRKAGDSSETDFCFRITREDWRNANADPSA